ncbi:hypothetical protein ABL78_2174 [Leptomonas seymouri]|uniref:Uncharacterized protein n=1 Tax=Leptomonas seymouri TaxID=5684 RepID=A0A0N1I9J9_LEPSE|nr:hypothetical protein ABL78_2174 [Leptomonas seymouri]|eukprot:KPI88714.1 hypothetical protein ABL78_2174 [Leptomonas seymouri]
MGFLSNLFKDKKKDNSRSASAHENNHTYHDPLPAENRALETLSQQQGVTPAPRAPSPQKWTDSRSEHSKEIQQPPNKQPPPLQAVTALQPQDATQAPQPFATPSSLQTNHDYLRAENRQRQDQAPQSQLSALKPAYCYTSGAFSETILREEAMLAKEYNFAVTEDRARAELTPSATRRAMIHQAPPYRNNHNVKDDEFNSIFTQFMHSTSGT